MHLPALSLCLAIVAPVSKALVNIEILTNLPYNFSVASALIWTQPAFDLAIDGANQRYAPVLNISLRLMFNPSDRDCTAVSSETVSELAKFYYEESDPETVYAVVSSICTDEAGIESVTTGWDWLLFSNALAQDDFLNATVSPTSVAIGGTFYSYAALVLKFLISFGWYHVTILEQKDAAAPFYTSIEGSLTAQIQNMTQNFTFDAQTVPFLHDSDSMWKALAVARTRSRVVLILAPGKTTLELLLLADAAGLANGEFVFINVQPLQQGTFGEISLFSQPQTTNLNAFRSFFFMAYRTSGTELQSLNDKLLARTQLLSPDANTGYDKDSQPLDSFAVQATIDLVDIVAMVVNETAPFRTPGTGWSGSHLADLMTGRYFTGLTTGDLYINSESERMLDMDIFAFSTNTASMQVFGRWMGRQQLLIRNNKTTVDWPTVDGRSPLDIPLCGFLGITGPCQPSGSSSPLIRILLPTVLGIAVASGVMIYAFAFRPVQRDWLIRQHELTFRRDSDRSCELGNAKWKNRRVWTKTVHLRKSPSRESLDAIVRPVTDIQHPNINMLFGVAILENRAILVSNFCKHGCITDLFNELHLDWDFKYSLITDLIDGICFIHGTLGRVHGQLQAKACLVDSRFTLRIAELGFADIIAGLTKEPVPQVDSIWAPPSDTNRLPRPHEMDVFALGMLVVAISIQGEPTRFRKPSLRCAVEIPSEVPSELRLLIGRCTSNDPEAWPRISTVKRAFEQMESLGSLKGQKIIDRVLARYSAYTATLENAVKERTEELNRERLKCDELLLLMLPAFVVEQLRTNRSMPAEHFESTSIFFSDLVGFVGWCGQVSPYRVIELLGSVYVVFDTEIANFKVQKIEAIADSYMVAGGIPVKNLGPCHAAEICRMAVVLMRRVQENRLFRHNFLLRIGIHSGSCAAGVIGTKVPRYCLFGDAVNIASRMETHGEGSRIHISFATVALLARHGTEFYCIKRGLVHVKGIGEMETYWLRTERD